MAKSATLCLLLVLLLGCDGSGGAAFPAPTRQAAAKLYEAEAMVLEDDSHGPMLCVGTIMDSLPPLCGDVPITNWDWSFVEDEESWGDATWGDYHVIGIYDGRSFTVTDAWPPEESSDSEGPEATPCPATNRYPPRDLAQIEADVWNKFGLRVLWSDVISDCGVVEMGVVATDARIEARLDKRYGKGVVKLFPALTPVSNRDHRRSASS